MLEEQLQVVAGLWSAEPGWSFDGKHYRVEDARYGPAPVQRPRPPLIVGTRGTTRGIRMAARWADHLNLYYCPPMKAAAAFAQLDAECRASGRDPRAVTRSVLLGTVVGEDRGQVERRREAILRTFGYQGTAKDWQRENDDMWIVGTPE
jgi:alkanesulfonate monooxygenase